MKDEGFANPGGAGPLAGAVLQPLRHLAGRGGGEKSLSALLRNKLYFTQPPREKEKKKKKKICSPADFRAPLT